MVDSPQKVLNNLLSNMEQLGASDLHIKAGQAPFFRVKRVLRAAKTPPVPDSAYVLAMLTPLIPDERKNDYARTGAVDFAARDASGRRFRVNMFRASGETHASIRRILTKIPTFEELNLPPIMERVVHETNEGLILVCGVTGVGKSTTLAAMLDYINRTRRVHIVTLEDPIEFVFHPQKAIISQREVGLDTADYQEALRSVLRQDPDCILIGELRDSATMLAALQAAETGHLVFGSMHVGNAQQAFKRVLEYFPPAEHQLVRSSLASNLQGIFCQKLLPGSEPREFYPAAEVLLRTPAVKDKILHGEEKDLLDIIDRSRSDGMQSFTRSLSELVKQGKVHLDTAMTFAPNRDALKASVQGIETM